ncbi:MAG: hypothetical protein WCD18_20330 [Thermosynechococcaceae cyanobacterium]
MLQNISGAIAAASMERPTMKKSKRFLVLANPMGYLTCVEPSNADLMEKYKNWEVLAQINRPMSLKLVDYSKKWAIKHFRL